MSEITGVFIVDDEEKAIESIKKHVLLRDDLLLMGYATDPLEALERIASLAVKVIFIDMKMEGMSGLEFIKVMGPSYTYICCTAYNDYGDKLSPLNVQAYLLKPVYVADFNINVDVCIHNMRLKEAGLRAIEEERLKKEGKLFVRLRGKNEWLCIPYDDIELLTGKTDETLIQCKDANYLGAGSLGDFEKLLPEALFIKIHRYHTVAKRLVHSLKRGKKLGLKPGSTLEEVALSDTYKEDIKLLLGLNTTENDKSNKSSA